MRKWKVASNKKIGSVFFVVMLVVGKNWLKVMQAIRKCTTELSSLILLDLSSLIKMTRTELLKWLCRFKFCILERNSSISCKLILKKKKTVRETKVSDTEISWITQISILDVWQRSEYASDLF